jgi:hypothetical protein
LAQSQHVFCLQLFDSDYARAQHQRYQLIIITEEGKKVK